MSVVHYRGGRIFTGEGTWAESIVVRDETIEVVGSLAQGDAVTGVTRTVDLDGALVLPGFVDAHTHLVGLGTSLGQVDLLPAVDLADIQSRLAAALAAAPQAPRVVGRSWLFAPLHGREPDRQALDGLDPSGSDRPVYLVSNDLHTGWVNTAALCELGIDDATPDPIGGRIGRDAAGVATGMLYETAALGLMRDFLEGCETAEMLDEALTAAFDHYLASGVTAAIDMGLGDPELAVFERALHRHGGRLPLRVAGHYPIDRTATRAGDLAQVQRAIEVHRRHQGPWFRMNGIKIFVDGVIDSCTAAMKKPFADGTHPGPIWELEALAPVVAAADAAGLQVAMHAIGDEASEIALSALEHAVDVNGPRPRRHRIEHLETVTEENVERLARLGVIASMQPVHADPAIQENWRARLGDERVERGFPWTEFTNAGATLVFGSDAPTAPYPPLPNMYIASTRRSALDATLEPNLPEYAVPLAAAIVHSTTDAAWSGQWEQVTGALRAGLAADFVVLDTDPFVVGEDALLTARVTHTVVAGNR